MNEKGKQKIITEICGAFWEWVEGLSILNKGLATVVKNPK